MVYRPTNDVLVRKAHAVGLPSFVQIVSLTQRVWVTAMSGRCFDVRLYLPRTLGAYGTLSLAITPACTWFPCLRPHYSRGERRSGISGLFVGSGALDHRQGSVTRRVVKAPLSNGPFPIVLCAEIMGYGYMLKLASLPFPC